MYIARMMKGIIPLRFMRSCNAEGVTLLNRLSQSLFGSPNWRRANGIIGTAFELRLIASRMVARLRKLFRMHPADTERDIPVYSVDRRGTLFDEDLPRIWLSEVVSNTADDSGRRIYVECYPSGSDEGGTKAFELAERYLGEGMHGTRFAGSGASAKRMDCMKAAEILLMHSVRNGNREAARRLRSLYEEELSPDERWACALEERARHSERGKWERLAS